MLDQSDAAWEPDQLILYGRHCPRETIRQTLQQIRQALGASKLLHLAFDEQTVIGSLCLTEGYEDRVSRNLEDLLARADYEFADASFARLCASAQQNIGDQLWPALTEQYVLQVTAAIASLKPPGHTFGDRARLRLVEEIRYGMYFADGLERDKLHEEPHIQSMILLGLSKPRSYGLIRKAHLLRKLAVQLKSTAEAAAQRDGAVMRLVGEQLRPQQVSSFAETASSALNLVLTVTKSDTGVIYILASEPANTLRRVAQQGMLSFRKDIPRRKSGPLASVMSQNKAVQLHDWLPPGTRRRESTPARGAVLVSPIPGPAGDPWGHAVGALVLSRPSETDAFSAYDLALVRNVALRIALARTTAVMSQIGRVTAELRRGIDWTKMSGGSRIIDEDSLLGVDAPIPTEIRSAVQLIEPALTELATLTDSRSATLRLALPTATEQQLGHGLVLIRVASYPKAPWVEDFAIQHEDHLGLNWKCFRDGEPVYEPNLLDMPNPEYLGVRPGTVSELVNPVRVEGATLGTINLESTLADAYAALRPLIAAFSGAVARTIADARAALEQNVIDAAAQALNHRHSMESHIASLSKRLDEASLSPEMAAILESELGKIRDHLIAMRRTESDSPTGDAAMIEILQRAAHEVQYLGDLPLFGPEAPTVISGDRVRALRTCVENVMSNMINYTATSYEESRGAPLREIYFGERCKLAGRDHLVVIFRNFSNTNVKTSRIVDLYRCPIPDAGGRLRVGGFLAGLNARRAGARLHSSVLSDRRTVQTTLVVPIGGGTKRASS